MKKISLVAFVLICSFLGKVNAQGSSKYQALFIYNFTRYIEWPSNGSSDFVIGVLGKSAVYDELMTVANGRKVGNQNIVVKKYSSAAEIGQCQIVFVSSNTSSEVATLAATSSSKNSLIIAERNGSISKGASINFVLEDGKQKFQLSKSNLAKNGLKVNAQLLDMALLVD